MREESTTGRGATRDEVGVLAITTPLSGGVINTTISAPLPKGTRINRYVLDDVLGAGGMGVVYRAFDPDTKREVALKLVRPETSVGTPASQGQARLLREAQAMARLSHPNTVGVFDVGTADDQVYIAMELIDGISMGAWLRERPRPWREVVSVMQQAGRGLEAAHQAGMVHRDFKPENVLIGRDGRVCVVDLGLARPVSQTKADLIHAGPSNQVAKLQAIVTNAVDSNLTRTGAVLGTPLYMSPEQHQSEKIDARTDQFSFCVSFYEALYGKRPFAADSRTELVYNVVHGQVSAPPPGAQVPQWLHNLVMRGLSTSPSARYPSMSELLEELDHNARRLWGGWSAVASAAALTVALVIFLAPPASSTPTSEPNPISVAPKNLDFEQGELAALPPGWQIVQPPRGQATAVISDEAPLHGLRCARLEAVDTGGADLLQTVDAAPFRGGRVRLHASARARVAGESRATLWLRTELSDGTASSHEQAIEGIEWSSRELSLEVGPDVARVGFGVRLTGQGQIWLDAVELDRLEKGWARPSKS